VPVTDTQVATLRTSLTHDAETMMRHAAELSDAGMDSYLYLAEAALALAARRRFAPEYTDADLIKFVASVRVSRLADGDEYDFDPTAGEAVLRSALGRNVQKVPSTVERFRAVTALLDALAGDFNTADVDRALTGARKIADEWLTGKKS
jgi:hypothetical protein